MAEMHVDRLPKVKGVFVSITGLKKTEADTVVKLFGLLLHETGIVSGMTPKNDNLDLYTVQMQFFPEDRFESFQALMTNFERQNIDISNKHMATTQARALIPSARQTGLDRN